MNVFAYISVTKPSASHVTPFHFSHALVVTHEGNTEASLGPRVSSTVLKMLAATKKRAEEQSSAQHSTA